MNPANIAISERIAKHLETQMARSYNGAIGCMYRDGSGHSCAVGCLIKDEAYLPTLEGKTAVNELVHEALFESGIDIEDAELAATLMSWQQYHDGASGGPTYGKWLNDPEHNMSPSQFHQSLLS